MSDDPCLHERAAARVEREAAQREYEVWRKLCAERSAAGLCPDCGEGHYPHGKDPTRRISLSKQAERDRYDRYRAEVRRLTWKLIAAFDADRLTAFDESCAAVYALVGHDGARALQEENPLSDRRSRRIRQLAQAARWHIRLPSGEMPARICERPGCGSSRVSFVVSRTAYVSCDGSLDDERNADVILCSECEAEHHGYWDDMWAEYRASQGV